MNAHSRVENLILTKLALPIPVPTKCDDAGGGRRNNSGATFAIQGRKQGKREDGEREAGKEKAEKSCAIS